MEYMVQPFHFHFYSAGPEDCVLNICSQHSDINDSNFVNSSACFTLLISSFLTKKPKWLENSQLLRKTWHVNQIFELILEQCVANYYGDNTIAK